MKHYPVLLKEVLELVNASQGSLFVDATVGAGGHTKAILTLNPKARVMGLDKDNETLGELKDELAQAKLLDRVVLIHSSYANIAEVASQNGFGKVSGIILDLGFSSMQLDDQGRGFSFQSNGPLDMRYDRKQKLTAAEVLNSYQEHELAEIFKKYGEENFSKKIARSVVVQRQSTPFSTADEVVHIIKAALPGSVRHKANDSIRRIFQALRIEVNHELEDLEKALPQMLKLLEPHGRLAIISFHSLEDRIVKNFFIEQAKDCVCPPDFPQCVCGKEPELKIITKKPVVASESELAENSRSKPAKLRVAEKI